MDEWRRRNGWSWPPSFRQIICWLIIILIIPLTAFMFIPLHFIYAPLVIGVVAVWIVILVVLLTTIDPVYSRVHSVKKPVHFDSSKHAHVIENFYCNVCQVYVSSNVKHCRQCNKCIEGFDHHCKWLNNCIGLINYKWFIVLMFSATLSSLGVSVGFIFVLVTSWANIELLASREKMPLSFSWWIVGCVLLCIAYIMATFSAGNLLLFHYRLWKNGLTTYGFIKMENNGPYENKPRPEVAGSKVRKMQHRSTSGECMSRSKRAIGDLSPPRMSLATITPLPEISVISK